MPGKGVVGRLLVLSVVAFVVLAGASVVTFLDTGEQWASAEKQTELTPWESLARGYDCVKYSDPDIRTMCQNGEGLFAADSAGSQPTGRNPAWKPFAAAAGVAAFVSLTLAGLAGLGAIGLE